MNFIISKAALKDIKGIWLYTAEHWSVQQADRYYHLIFDEIDYISHYPLSGKDCSHIRKDYRCSKVKSHVIFYRVNKSNEIEVIRLLHERMDVGRSLEE